MGDLRMTPARLALLRAVADGKVAEHYPIFDEPGKPYSIWEEREMRVEALTPPTVSWPSYTVTSRIAELDRAGLVRIDVDEPPWSPWGRGSRRWHLADAGRAVLEASR